LRRFREAVAVPTRAAFSDEGEEIKFASWAPEALFALVDQLATTLVSGRRRLTSPNLRPLVVRSFHD